MPLERHLERTPRRRRAADWHYHAGAIGCLILSPYGRSLTRTNAWRLQCTQRQRSHRYESLARRAPIGGSRFDNPPLNVMGPQFVREMREIVAAIEADERVKVVVFDSAVDGFFLNHSDFHADMKDLTSMPQGPTGLEAWPDILVRLTRAPVVSIALIRGRATGNGSEIALACDMSFASREKARSVAMGSGGRPGRRRRTRWRACRGRWADRERWRCC